MKTSLLILTTVLFGVSKINASVIYDFEDTKTGATTIITDKHGPTLTNVSVASSRLVDFNGGQGVTFNGSAGQALNLGTGSSGELNQSWAQGFTFSITFRADTVGNTERALFGKYASTSNERSMTLSIRPENSAQPLRLLFSMSGDGINGEAVFSTASTGAITLGEVYTVKVTFNPALATNQLTLAIYNADGSLKDSVSASSSLTGLFTSNVSMFIGGREASGDANAFIGVIGDVSLVVPEPSVSLLGLLTLPGVCWFLKNQRRLAK